MFDYKNSVANVLGNLTQEQVDTWTEAHKLKKMSLEDFVSGFRNFNKEGLISLLSTIAMTPISKESIEKSEDDKVILYHKLAARRLKNEGFNDNNIQKQIFNNVSATYNLDTLLGDEIQKGVSQSALTLNEASDEVINTTSLREAIIAEQDAVNLYEQLAERVKDEKLKKLFLSIAEEEKVHIGEFEAKLSRLDIRGDISFEEGKKEASDMLDRPVHLMENDEK